MYFLVLHRHTRCRYKVFHILRRSLNSFTQSTGNTSNVRFTIEIKNTLLLLLITAIPINQHGPINKLKYKQQIDTFF